MESAFEKLQRDLARDAEQQAEKKAAAAATVAEVQPGLLVRRLQNFPSPPFASFISVRCHARLRWQWT